CGRALWLHPANCRAESQLQTQRARRRRQEELRVGRLKCPKASFGEIYPGFSFAGKDCHYLSAVRLVRDWKMVRSHRAKRLRDYTTCRTKNLSCRCGCA